MITTLSGQSKAEIMKTLSDKDVNIGKELFMQRLVLASHGYLAEGMKNSAQIIVGKSAKIYTICAYVKEGITLESQINELFRQFSRRMMR